MMASVVSNIKNLLDQNFYGLLILCAAFYFYKVGEREGATAFFAAGTTLMGIRTPNAPSLRTTQNVDGSMTTAVVTEGK
jgi:hypothetical protein